MRPVHYLESLDSVRAPVLVTDGHVPRSTGTQRSQAEVVRCEALLALAFGRDIVIPQSYVLDSYASQELVRTIAAAEAGLRDRDADVWLERPRALRLHLFRQQSFLDAAAAVFAGVTDAVWRSSMYPDLTGTARARSLAESMRQGGVGNPLDWLPDWRSDLFEVTWRYFRTAHKSDERRVVRPVATTSSLTLDRGVRAFVAANGEGTGKQAEAVSETAAALSMLISQSPDEAPFAGRSRVHAPEPWSGRPGDPSARDLISDDDLVQNVLEVVNTLYNQTVVNSIGPISASYSTRVGPLDDVSSEGTVQEQALATSSSTFQPMVGASFEICFDQASLAKALETHPSLLSTAVFEEVLRARESRSWTASFERLEDAGRGSTADRTRAVHAHTRLLAKALHGQAQLDVDDTAQLRFSVRNATAQLLGVGGPAFLAVFDPWLGLSALLPVAASQVWPVAQRRRRLGLTHGTLGKLVRARGDAD